MKKEIFKGEMMNEMELNAVVGGTRGEISCDTKFLHAIGVMNKYYEPGYVEKHMDEVVDEMRSEMRLRGFLDEFDITYSLNGNNKYRLKKQQNKPITRSKMYQIISTAVADLDFDYTKYV